MKQFNTFAANSPALSDYYSPKGGSQRFAFPSSNNTVNDVSRTSAIDPLRFINSVNEHYNKAYRVDRRIQAARNRQEMAEENNDSLLQVESKVSMLLSEVSVPAAPPLEIQPQRLFNLENNITQQILELREQKITLMQELSRILDTKNLFEHYLLKASREKEEVETNMGSFRESQHKEKNATHQEYVPISVSAPILKRNEELHLRLKELQIKQEIFGPNFQQSEEDRAKNQHLLEEIIQVRELNSNLKDEIANKLKKNEVKESRFVTFLPQDRQKHFDSKSNLQEYQELQEKYKKLQGLKREQNVRLTHEEAEYLQSLRNENRALIQQAENMLRAKKSGTNSITELQKRLEENEREKQVFLKELERFKETMRRTKEENERLKYELSH